MLERITMIINRVRLSPVILCVFNGSESLTEHNITCYPRRLIMSPRSRGLRMKVERSMARFS